MAALGSHHASACPYTHTWPSSSGVSASPQQGRQPRARPGTEEQGLSRGSLFAGKRGRKPLWLLTHHLRWEQGPKIPPKAAEGLTQPHCRRDIAPSSWVLVCRSHTVIPVWDPPRDPCPRLWRWVLGSLRLLDPGPSAGLLSCLQTLPTGHLSASRGLQNTSWGFLGGQNTAHLVQVLGTAWLLQERMRRCLSLSCPSDGWSCRCLPTPHSPPNNRDRGLGDGPQPRRGSDHTAIGTCPLVLIPEPSWMLAEDISP